MTSLGGSFSIDNMAADYKERGEFTVQSYGRPCDTVVYN